MKGANINFEHELKAVFKESVLTLMLGRHLVKALRRRAVRMPLGFSSIAAAANC